MSGPQLSFPCSAPLPSSVRHEPGPNDDEATMFPGHWQILLVLLVVLLLFGNRLPMLARSLGASLVEFKKGVKEIDDAKPEDNKPS